MEPEGDSHPYSHLLQDEEDDSNVVGLESDFREKSLWQKKRNLAFLIINIGLAVLSLVSAFVIIKARTQSPNWLLEQLSFYCKFTLSSSPIFSRLEIPNIEHTVKGTLFNEHHLLVREAPSAQVDAAWHNLTDVGVVIISGEEVLRLGKDPSMTVKAPTEWNFGPDAHLAQMDGQHALHCLNAVRRYAYREYYFPEFAQPATTRKPTRNQSDSPLSAGHQAHLSHCLHVLLQTLTCNPSTDFITHNWVRTQHYPYPDFNIQRKCRDHGALLAWQEENRITEKMWVEMAARGPGEGKVEVELMPLMREWVEGQRDAKAKGGDGNDQVTGKM